MKYKNIQLKQTYIYIIYIYIIYTFNFSPSSYYRLFLSSLLMTKCHLLFISFFLIYRFAKDSFLGFSQIFVVQSLKGNFFHCILIEL